MLSAICLVNYFEGGELPKDRALLYQLCVEGLLHNWDQRRGIRSEFTLDEKLRVCREVALNMQADDRAEYPAERIQEIFAEVLGDAARARFSSTSAIARVCCSNAGPMSSPSPTSPSRNTSPRAPSTRATSWTSMQRAWFASTTMAAGGRSSRSIAAWRRRPWSETSSRA